MTIAAAWVRTLDSGAEELIFCSDSRLSNGKRFDHCQKTFRFVLAWPLLSAMLGLYVDVRAAEGVEQELLAGHGVVVAIQQAPPTEVMVEVFCGHAVETVHPGF